jgi:NAD(P)-dependent dehydrogenase (short-subunit alcohol dehydrogenase family)
MSIARALVIGAGGEVGRATVLALEAAGIQVTAAGRDRDATSPVQVAALLAESSPDLVVIAAGTRPRMAPVSEQSWESFSAAWEVDVRIAFEVGQAVLTQPLRPGSTVVIVSSGAAVVGSPLSGGYAGAKRMQMFLAQYLQQAADVRGLGIRFVAVVPQMLARTAIGLAAASAYGAPAGLSGEEHLRRAFPVPLDAAGLAAAILAVDQYPDAAVLKVTGGGIEVMGVLSRRARPPVPCGAGPARRRTRR